MTKRQRKPFHVLVHLELKALPPDRTVRLAFLVKWAAFRRHRSDPRSHGELRAAYKRGNPRGATLVGQCWACSGWADVFTHHIVQLQNGGTNNRFNLVRICGECHRQVHPWLPKPKEATQHAPPEEPVPF